MDRLSATRRAPFGDNPEVGARGRQTQQRILAAAFEAFDEVGVSNTSVEAITERAGCSRPTFYQYFESKEELFGRLAARFGEDLARLTAELGAIDATETGRDELLAWIAQLVEVHDRHRPVARGFAASLRGDENIRSGSSALVERYRTALLAVLDDPLAPPDAELDVLVGLVMVTVYGACNYRELVPRRLARGRFIASLADVVHRCLFGPIDGVNLGSRGSPTTTRPKPLVTPPAATGEQTRDRLAAAAAAVFGEQGYDATSIDDIVDTAELSHGAFYRYFDDKAAAFREVALIAAGEMIARLGELPTPDQGLRPWCHDFYATFAQHGRLFSVWPEATEAGVDAATAVEQAVSAQLRAALAGRAFGDADADAVALIALFERGPNSVFAYGASTAEQAADATSVFLERAFLGVS